MVESLTKTPASAVVNGVNVMDPSFLRDARQVAGITFYGGVNVRLVSLQKKAVLVVGRLIMRTAHVLRCAKHLCAVVCWPDSNSVGGAS